MSNKEDALRIMREIVEEYGDDYLYPSKKKNLNGECRYVYGGEPACIAGVFLSRWGVPIEELGRREGSSAMVVASATTSLPPGVVEALNKAQGLQDIDETWGRALAVFEGTLRKWYE